MNVHKTNRMVRTDFCRLVSILRVSMRGLSSSPPTSFLTLMVGMPFTVTMTSPAGGQRGTGVWFRGVGTRGY